MENIVTGEIKNIIKATDDVKLYTKENKDEDLYKELVYQCITNLGYNNYKQLLKLKKKVSEVGVSRLGLTLKEYADFCNVLSVFSLMDLAERKPLFYLDSIFDIDDYNLVINELMSKIDKSLLDVDEYFLLENKFNLIKYSDENNFVSNYESLLNDIIIICSKYGVSLKNEKEKKAFDEYFSDIQKQKVYSIYN